MPAHVTLVAGVDSSTQSCKVVVRDADDRRAGARRAGRRTRTAPRSTRPPGGSRCRRRWPRRRRARRRRRGRGRRAAARHGVPRRGRRGRPPGAAVERHPVRRRGRATWSPSSAAARPWADAVGIVPVASFTVTKLRWLAEHEPDNAARAAAVCLPHDWLTWRLARRRRPRRAAHRPRRRQRHRLLVAGDRGRTGRTCSSARFGRDARGARACSARRGAPARPPAARCSARAPATTRPPRSGVGAGPGDVVVSIGTSGSVCAVADRRRPPTRPAPWPASPTPPAASCRWSAPSTRPGCSTPPRALLGVDHDGLSRAGAVARRPAPTGWCWCRTSRASAPRTGRTRPARCTA